MDRGVPRERGLLGMGRGHGTTSHPWGRRPDRAALPTDPAIWAGVPPATRRQQAVTWGFSKESEINKQIKIK